MRKKRVCIERITITGNQEERQKAREYCDKNGFLITHSGYRKINRREIDTTRFKIVAERRIEVSK